MSTCVMLAPWSARTVVRADIMPGRSKAVTRMACALMYSPNYNSSTMKQIVFIVCALLVAAVLRPGEAAAQGQPNMYGPTITADQAKSVAAAAVAEARKNQWTMAVAIVDPSGDLVYFEKMDNTQVGSID